MATPIAADGGGLPIPLEAIVESSPLGIIVFEPVRDGHGAIVDLTWRYLNAAARRILADLPDDAVGRGLLETIPENREAGTFQGYVRAVETGEPYEAELSFASEVVTGVFRIHADRVGEHLVVRFSDVTGRVRAEEGERESNRRILRTLSRITDAVVAVDERWRFSYVNPRAEQVLGRTGLDLIGRDIWVEYPLMVGTVFERQYRHAVAHREPVSFEAYYPPPLDTWFEVRAYPGPEGQGLTVFFHDVGARRRFEEHAARVQRLESLATMAAGISHDFSNLLMAIDGHARMAEEAAVDPAVRDDLAAIRDSASRAIGLTRRLSAFSRAQVLRPRVVDLDGAVERARFRLEALLPPGCRLDLRPATTPVLVDVDPDELDRALLQLADNAGQAMIAGDRLLVETSLVEVTDEQVTADPEQEPGRYGVVTLADDGRGMEPGVLARAVEPFFTTRRSTGGVGLGLSSVHGMVSQAGGRLSLFSEPGVGTTVRLYLPRSVTDPPLTSAVDHGVGAAEPGGTETVLVVDYHRSGRDLVQRILTDHGYTVLAPDRPSAAPAVLDGHMDEVALLVADVMLGAWTGGELAAEARRRRPDLPVLYISGDPDGVDVVTGMAQPGTAVLSKPFSPSELLVEVRSLLDGDRAADEGRPRIPD